MNNTTRSLIFFIGLFSVIFYYFSIIPILPYAMILPNAYVNYLAAAVIIIFPTVQLLMRTFVLKKYQLKDESLFHLNIHDAKIINRITYYALAFLIILLPITGNRFDFSALLPIHYFTFAVWVMISELWLFITYKTTKAYFGKEYILISGIDFRLDFPIGSILYSHSGVYYYQDFKYYYVEGNILYLSLENDRGKIAVKLSSNITNNVISYLNAHKIKSIQPF